MVRTLLGLYLALVLADAEGLSLTLLWLLKVSLLLGRCGRSLALVFADGDGLLVSLVCTML